MGIARNLGLDEQVGKKTKIRSYNMVNGNWDAERVENNAF
jgi:hypothetical protein